MHFDAERLLSIRWLRVFTAFQNDSTGTIAPVNVDHRLLNIVADPKLWTELLQQFLKRDDMRQVIDDAPPNSTVVLEATLSDWKDAEGTPMKPLFIYYISHNNEWFVSSESIGAETGSKIGSVINGNQRINTRMPPEAVIANNHGHMRVIWKAPHVKGDKVNALVLHNCSRDQIADVKKHFENTHGAKMN